MFQSSMVLRRRSQYSNWFSHHHAISDVIGLLSVYYRVAGPSQGFGRKFAGPPAGISAAKLGGLILVVYWATFGSIPRHSPMWPPNPAFVKTDAQRYNARTWRNVGRCGAKLGPVGLLGVGFSCGFPLCLGFLRLLGVRFPVVERELSSVDLHEPGLGSFLRNLLD